MNCKRIVAGAFLLAALVVSGCAEQARRVPATYVPSIVYRGASCQELAHERQVLAGYVTSVARDQRNAAKWDTAGVVVGTLIFWPALFALPMTTDKSAQLASARGHYDALVKAQTEQGCGGVGTAGQMRPVYQYSAPQAVGTWKRYPGQFPPM